MNQAAIFKIIKMQTIKAVGRYLGCSWQRKEHVRPPFITDTERERVLRAEMVLLEKANWQVLNATPIADLNEESKKITAQLMLPKRDE